MAEDWLLNIYPTVRNSRHQELPQCSHYTMSHHSCCLASLVACSPFC
jgi:hypothetical protein